MSDGQFLGWVWLPIVMGIVVVALLTGGAKIMAGPYPDSVEEPTQACDIIDVGGPHE